MVKCMCIVGSAHSLRSRCTAAQLLTKEAGRLEGAVASAFEHLALVVFP